MDTKKQYCCKTKAWSICNPKGFPFYGVTLTYADSGHF